MDRDRAHQRVPGTMRAELVGVEVGHGSIPMPHKPSQVTQTRKLGSRVGAHAAHKPTEAHKPL